MELYQRKSSSYWWLTYSIGGKRYRESTKTINKHQAKAYLAKRETELFEGRFFPNKRSNELTMEGLRDKWLKHAPHKGTIDKDERLLTIRRIWSMLCGDLSVS